MPILAGIAVIALIAVFMGILVGFPIMWLWNWLMPVVFGLPKITFLQAWGMFVLSNLLLKSNNNEAVRLT